MNSSTSALIIALVGITGTLASALLTQRGASKNAIRELERADQQRREERAYQAEKTTIDDRRTCYVALNIAARLYQTALTNYLVDLQLGAPSDEIRAAVEETRIDHRTRHAEAQMVLPDSVLEVAGAVNGNLGKFYGILRSIDLGNSNSNETLETAEARRETSWDLLAEMRTVMRQDLGIAP